MGYPTNNCKTQSLGGGFHHARPKSLGQLNMVYPELSGLGYIEILSTELHCNYLKYCPPTMVCCLKFEIHVTIGNPCKVKPTS